LTLAINPSHDLIEDGSHLLRFSRGQHGKRMLEGQPAVTGVSLNQAMVAGGCVHGPRVYWLVARRAWTKFASTRFNSCPQGQPYR
jgi:hypothetical protein